MRLIDADALMDRMYHDAFETDTDMQKWDSGCWIRYKMFENAIEDAPTIDAVSEWIPCSERLPSNRDIIVIQYKIKYAGKWEIGYSTTRYIYGEFVGYDHEEVKVLAWMPLPKPYGEAKE